MNINEKLQIVHLLVGYYGDLLRKYNLYMMGDESKDTKLTCLQIYNTSEIKIINRKEI